MGGGNQLGTGDDSGATSFLFTQMCPSCETWKFHFPPSSSLSAWTGRPQSEQLRDPIALLALQDVWRNPPTQINASVLFIKYRCNTVRPTSQPTSLFSPFSFYCFCICSGCLHLIDSGQKPEERFVTKYSFCQSVLPFFFTCCSLSTSYNPLFSIWSGTTDCQRGKMSCLTLR